MATDWEIIKTEVSKIKNRFNIDIDDSAIIIEVLKVFNGVERNFFADIDTKKIKEYLFAKEKDKMNEKLYEITGRNFNGSKSKVSKTLQEAPEWEHTMYGYFNS